MLNKIDDNGDTALTLAAYKGLDKVCELLISKMSNQAISTINSNGETALTYAASKGLSKVCMQLIPLMSAPAINTMTKTYGTIALTCAAWKG
ncbi:MAG: ankyrin repeat domain-containing protein [Rickettsia conorii subsp. raoultii]|uniref:Ankyrin repeat domain-containing protein n=1 Tax=Rickettsia conorii subsp. raoultii TaxID=369822 RepID=A0ABY4TZ24_RICCR|nr:ankyrin repeat domain-containing protein [Rickettsia conorii]URW77259.1 ankyrin repeat domain-containing protein [Rickettsia conorii subsp. raoultii]